MAGPRDDLVVQLDRRLWLVFFAEPFEVGPGVYVSRGYYVTNDKSPDATHTTESMLARQRNSLSG